MDSPRSPRLMIGALLVATFMGFLDLFIVTVALPAIRRDLDTSFPTAQLVIGVYVVAYGVALVTGGRLGDRYGRRLLLVAGMVGFTISSALCAVAWNATSLVIARGLQGLSAAAMLPQVLSTIQVAVPSEWRAAAIGAYGAVIGIASVSGQILGGTLVEADLWGLGWRVLFLLNIPIGVLGVLLLLRRVPDSRASRATRLDVRGAAGLSVTLLALLLALVEGPDRGWPAWTFALLAAGIAAASATAQLERNLEARGRAPLVPPALLRRRPVRIGLAVTLAFYASSTGLFVVLAFFLEDGLHASAAAAGFTFAPLGAAFATASLLSRRYADRGPQMMIAGAIIACAGLASVIAVVRAGGGPVALALPLAVVGAGQGMLAPPLIATVLSRVPSEDAGAASGILLTATQVANALGVAVVGGVYTATFSQRPADAFTVSAGVAIALTAAAGGAAEALRRRGFATA